MTLLLELNLRLAHFIQPHLQDIALALVATCLVIYGYKVNAFLQRLVSSCLFVVRVTVVYRYVYFLFWVD